MPQLMCGDVTLHYELDGSGMPAVYISGLTDHSNSYFGAILRQALSERYQLLALDNRGSGQTITPEGTSVTMENMADDIAAVMDHLQFPSAHVLGISMGGMIAMTLTLRHPEKVRSLVVAVSSAYSPPPPNRSAFMVETSRQLIDRNMPPDLINRFNALFLIGESLFEYQPLLDAWVNAPPDPLAQTRLGFEQQVAALETYDIRDRIHTITAPTLVISSTEDMLLPPRFQDEIAAKIPNAEMKRYPGGHVFMGMPMYSRQFVEDVVTFWQKHSR